MLRLASPPSLSSLWSMLVLGLAALTGGCDAQGCAAGCLADCISDCASDCGSCDSCDCSECGCAILPIPGGFPSGQDERGDQRLPNATQVRLSPQGLRFIEQNLTDIAGAAVPGGLDQAIPSGVQGGGAIGINVNVMLCAARVLQFGVPSAELVNGAQTRTGMFTAASSGTALLAVESPFGNTLNTSFEVRSVADNVVRCSGSFLAPNAGSCQFPIVAGTEYRVSTTRAAVSVGPSSNVRVFAPSAAGCSLHPEVGAADAPVVLDPTDEFIDARAPILATSVNAAGARTAWPMVVWETIGIIDTGYQECTVDLNTRRQNPPSIPVNVEVGIGDSASRPGYGQLAIGDFSIDMGSVQVGDIQTDCNAFGLSPQQLVDLVTTFTGDPADTITEAIQQVKDDLATLCQPALLNPTTNERDICPSGSTPVVQSASVTNCHGYTDSNANGLFDAGEPVSGQCVSQLLGAEVRVDMGGLLSSISPGLRAAIDVLFAAQDDAAGLADGYTVPFYGGFNSLVQASSCIDPLTPEELTALDLDSPPNDVELAAAFSGGADTHHIQAGLSERVMNWGAYQLWESGALCIQATTRLDQLLSTSLFSLLIRSLRDLAFPADGAALGLALRPGQPPRVILGAGTEEDPFVTVALPELSIDFYVWSTERYVRFMTFTADLTVKVNLPVTDGALVPDIVGVDIDNASVTNNNLIREDPATVTTAVERVVPIALGMASSAIPTIDIDQLLADAGLPIGIDFGADSLRLVEDDLGGGETERYLGVFINLAADPAPLTQRVDTSLEVMTLNVPDARVFDIETLGVGERPSIEIAVNATGPEGVEYEYQHRLDGQRWSEWTRSPYAVVSHDALLLQGRHTVDARARVVGGTDSTDLTPARAEVLIDVLSPDVETVITADGTLLRTGDAVSNAAALEFRYREVDTTEWSSWTALGTPERLVAEATGQFEFEVRDEAGNVGSNTESLRGLPPPSDGGGCGDCSTGESDGSRPLYGLLSLLALGLMLRRKREGGEHPSVRRVQ